jgi:hypothetical protein
MHGLQCPDADDWNFLRNIVVVSPVWNTTRLSLVDYSPA